MVKPVRLTAPEYINALCDWIESQVRPRPFSKSHLQALTYMLQAAATARALDSQALGRSLHVDTSHHSVHIEVRSILPVYVVIT